MTDGEIRYALYKQTATIKALVAMLQEKELLSTEDPTKMEANREKLFQSLQPAEEAGGGKVIRRASALKARRREEAVIRFSLGATTDGRVEGTIGCHPESV